MNKVVIVLMLFLLTSCTCAHPVKVETNNKPIEKNWNPSVKRIENSEVICYVYYRGYAGGLSCKWKDENEK